MAQTELHLLREFLAADDGLVSGARLARDLGVSRVAIWAQLQKLTKQGFTFSSEPGRGYRLTGTPARLHAPLIKAYLGRRSALPDLVCLDITDSTNSEAERRLAAGAAAPLVILAQEQTHGRGRRGRPWHSALNGNLYVTFVFRPELEPARLQDFTLWIGLNLCELIGKFCKLTPGLKWPNDLLLDGRKLAGLLTEARVDADQIRDLVLGIGLNVNGRASALPPDLGRLAVSLADATGGPVDLNRFAAALIGRVGAAYEQFLSGRHRDTFADLWSRYDLLRDRPVTVIQGTHTVKGTALGIDDEGSLIVRTDSGRTERFRAGEVTLGKAPA